MVGKFVLAVSVAALIAAAKGDGGSEASSPTSSPTATPARGAASRAATNGLYLDHYQYCDSCVESHKRVTMESDVFVPTGVADYVPMNGADYRRDIAPLAADGLALGLKRKTCVRTAEAMVHDATVDPYTSGPPPPLGTSLREATRHSCAAAANRVRRCRVSEDGDGHFSEVGGILFFDAGKGQPSPSSYSYIFVPCAYVPLLPSLTWKSAEDFRKAHAELTLSCSGHHNETQYPREYQNFTCPRPKSTQPK